MISRIPISNINIYMVSSKYFYLIIDVCLHIGFAHILQPIGKAQCLNL